jgi:hypothetical protein
MTDKEQKAAPQMKSTMDKKERIAYSNSHDKETDCQHDTREGSSGRPGALLEIFISYK